MKYLRGIALQDNDYNYVSLSTNYVGNFRAKKAADLRRHISSHDAGKQYWCDYEGCNFTARAVVTLRRHYSREHTENVSIIKVKKKKAFISAFTKCSKRRTYNTEYNLKNSKSNNKLQNKKICGTKLE